MSITENERWLMSFYRNSEITGALFFGRLAQYISNKEIKHDLSKHFADESMHGWWWTEALQELGSTPMRNFGSYQDKYFDSIGIPANIMEILAITQVFERRVINQYKRHLMLKDVNPVVEKVLRTIMIDEGWHYKWVTDALESLEGEYGKEFIAETIKKYETADNEIFGKFLTEHDERITELFGKKVGRWEL